MEQSYDSLDNNNLLSKLSYQKNSLSGAHKRLVDYILNHKDHIVSLNISQLAINAQVGEATIIRLAKHFGYRGFADFKIDLAIAISDKSYENGSLVANKIDENDDSYTVAKKIATQVNIGLEENLKIFDQKTIEYAAKSIFNARKILVLGMGNSGICADFLQNKLARINIEAYCHINTHFMYTQASLLTSVDVAIAISHKGSVYETIKGLKIAKQAGATCIAITQNKDSELAKYADVILQTGYMEQASHSDSLSIIVSQLHLCEALYTQIVLFNQNKAMSSMKKTIEALSLRV